MNRTSIEVGQRFERLGRWRRTWVVEAVIEGAGPTANVVLRDAADPANKCTLAPQALLDPSRFRAVGREEPGAPASPTRARARGRRELRPGGLAGQRVVALPRQRQETAMMIETRSPAGYVVICRHTAEEHRFVAKHPGMDVTCPRCGSTAKSVALLLDYIGAAPPWRQINAPARRRIADRGPPAPGPAHGASPGKPIADRQDPHPAAQAAIPLTGGPRPLPLTAAAGAPISRRCGS